MGRFYRPVVVIVRLREHSTRSRVAVSRSVQKTADFLIERVFNGWHLD
jgi:hypothetical protein